MLDNRSANERPSLEQYFEWYFDNLGEDLNGGQPEQWHKKVTDAGRLDLERSEFWQRLQGSMLAWDAAFREANKNFALLAPLQPKEIATKTYDSALNKAFRLNCFRNVRWPDPPDPPPSTAAEAAEGDPYDVLRWYGPHNWLREFPDIFRIRLQASYFDGVTHLAKKAKELAEQTTTARPPKLDLLAQQDGYHAAHLLVHHDLNVDDFTTRQFISVPVSLEIQITTDTQAKIITMLHDVYKEWRVLGTPHGWQWEHGSTAFAINYLGSTLHYLEGMMVRARDDGGGENDSQVT